MANKLAMEQVDDSFTQLVLDPKPNKSMSIQEHINRDKIKKSPKWETHVNFRSYSSSRRKRV